MAQAVGEEDMVSERLTQRKRRKRKTKNKNKTSMYIPLDEDQCVYPICTGSVFVDMYIQCMYVI